MLKSKHLTRRSFAMAAPYIAIISRARAADFRMRQFHNQPVESPLHKRCLQMWAAVERETRGRVQVSVVPLNNNMKDGDPDPLQMVLRGELEFFTLAGNGLSALVPAANAQATPYAFRSSAEALRIFDGELGNYIRDELKGKGLYAVPRGCFDNGMHQITTASRPVHTAVDLQGLKMRVPGSQLYQEFFQQFGATTQGMNINQLHDALQSGRVEAQDDPFDVAELFKLYEVQKYISVTNHSWSGYNFLASVKTWQSLPSDIQSIVERNVQKYVALQRADAKRLNGGLRRELVKRGMTIVDPDTSTFRAPLAKYYPRWKQSIGSRAATLLEAQVGKLGA